MENNNWLEWAVRLQALAQNGLAYDPAPFDRERYEEIRDIAVQMLEAPSGLPKDRVKELFAGEEGYQTPKIDTRAAIFKEDKVLLVQELNGLWALPGGAMELGESSLEAAIREFYEETGIEVQAKCLLNVYTNFDEVYPNGDQVQTVVFIYELTATEIGNISDFHNEETLKVAFFTKEEIDQLDSISDKHRLMLKEYFANDFQLGR